jgi:hypothetical protein
MIRSRCVDDKVIRHLVQVGAQIGAWSLPSRQLIQEFREYIPHDVICRHGITAQA